MKIILLQDDKKLGKKGQIIEANDGFARNYILPKKIGVEATPKNLNDLKLQKANEEKVAQQQLDAAKELAAVLETKQVVVKMKAGEGGRVFGSVSSKEIVAEYAVFVHLVDQCLVEHSVPELNARAIVFFCHFIYAYSILW